MNKMSKKPWRKVLYEPQGYTDNYTDKSQFLRDLRKNVDLSQISVIDAILVASEFTQELCTVIFFVLVYVYLLNSWVKPEEILTASSIMTSIGFFVYRLLSSSEGSKKDRYHLRTVLIFVIFGHLFSPVLHTLTDTISTDSIYTTTSLALLLHLMFFDYDVNVAIVSKSLSFNASIFGAICLASRLPSTFHAFILVTLAVKCFVLFPLLRRQFHISSMLTVFLIAVNVYLLLFISKILMLLFIVILVFINIVCPVLYTNNRKYKENIYGPWDEAVIGNSDMYCDH